MKYSIYISIFLIGLLGCRDTIPEIPLKPHTFAIRPVPTQTVAGTPIEIQLKTNATADLSLIISNAFGSAVIKPTHKKNVSSFRFPNEFAQRSGICQWSLVHDHKVYQKGEINIRPNPGQGTTMESYLGPRSISAGGTDFSMFVVSPTDNYDNPLTDGTEIAYTYQFNNTIQSIPVELNKLIGWKNIQSTEKSGRLLVTASCNDAKSKALTTLVYPAHAIDFKIDFTRNHQFADGNQIIRFSTDVIKDAYGNVISDGTLVSFSVLNSEGMLLQTKGTTINGVAKAELLHPIERENWEITAYITGTAKSNSLKVSFEAAVRDFNVSLSQDHRIITIANIESFMGQWIPDGLPISIEIKDGKGNSIGKKHTTSRKGKAVFTLPGDFYPKGNYQVQVEIAGILKTINTSLQ
ncbi:hypothetical protein [Maribacter polysaccharolyticus]|uniref:hypothetical protein n=1 Tax=Maribacter polysaccharolyticus TaxID=3020831 RepID=UPI00237F37CB|nr:hypothetical protein [Maribacter polysaccharolyticus]MDE3742653.1 hypothetical protein [Maribacter polysaccharolyticus]